MGLMQTNGGVHMGTDTVAVAATQCEQAFNVNLTLFCIVLISQHNCLNVANVIQCLEDAF